MPVKNKRDEKQCAKIYKNGKRCIKKRELNSDGSFGAMCKMHRQKSSKLESEKKPKEDEQFHDEGWAQRRDTGGYAGSANSYYQSFSRRGHD